MSLGGLEIALVAAALLAGLTGTWSPCGFSMIETIGPVGHTGGRANTTVACLTFTLGALAGGVATFASLALLGELVHGGGDRPAYVLGALLALGAAALEARGAAIIPQVRRQLPEHWRRRMPMPLAAALYGVLLGVGFTTFVLTFGVFALAGICFAVGEPALGLLVGLAFGAGRALPIALTAPFANRPAGIRMIELMAERPAILHGFRLGDAAALLMAAVALAVATPAGASQLEATLGADPSVGGGELAFQRPDRSGFLRRGGESVALPGRDPALGGGRIAVLDHDEIAILSAPGIDEVGRISAPQADAVAISKRWLAWRTRSEGRDLMRARRLENAERPGPVKHIGRAGGAAQLGRPSLDGNRLVYARATRNANSIVKRSLGAKRKKSAKTTLLRSRTQGLSNPSIRGRALLYVLHTRGADRLMLASLEGRSRGRTLLSRRSGTLWSTALGQKRAYVTHIHGTTPRQKVLSAAR